MAADDALRPYARAAPKKLWSYLRSWTTWFWTRRRLVMQLGRMDWYAFKKQMAPRYIKFHEALAAGDQHILRSLMTEAGFNVRCILNRGPL